MKKTFRFGLHTLGAWAILLVMAMGMSSCSSEAVDNSMETLFAKGIYEVSGLVYDDARVWRYMKLNDDDNWTATLVESLNGKKFKSVGTWKVQNSGKEVKIDFSSGDRSGQKVVLKVESTTFAGMTFTVDGVKYEMSSCKTKDMEDYMNSGDATGVDFSAFCGTWHSDDAYYSGLYNKRVWKSLSMNADNTFKLTEVEGTKELQSSGTWRTANNAAYLILDVTGGEGKGQWLQCQVWKSPQTGTFEMDAPSTDNPVSNRYNLTKAQ